jgi:hypothetical protein
MRRSDGLERPALILRAALHQLDEGLSHVGALLGRQPWDLRYRRVDAVGAWPWRLKRS